MGIDTLLPNTGPACVLPLATGYTGRYPFLAFFEAWGGYHLHKQVMFSLIISLIYNVYLIQQYFKEDDEIYKVIFFVKLCFLTVKRVKTKNYVPYSNGFYSIFFYKQSFPRISVYWIRIRICRPNWIRIQSGFETLKKLRPHYFNCHFGGKSCRNN